VIHFNCCLLGPPYYTTTMYRIQHISFEDIPQLSERDRAYQRQDQRLQELIVHEPVLSSFAKAIKARRTSTVDRELLVEVLTDQYQKMASSPKVQENIKRLTGKNTYTVITAHQPSILTGPLYYIYKIASAISLAKQLNEEDLGITVVPVFITGGEDHDFDEIATMHLFNQDFSWKTDQVGATGRMNLDGLDDVLSDVKEKLGDNEYARDLKRIIDSSFEQAENYGQFMIMFTNELFKDYGLVVANMDDRRYKDVLLPYVLRDLVDKDSQRCVEKDQNTLEAQGFKRQAHAREVNIFWHDGDRHRVVPVGKDTYRIGEDIYTEDALTDLLKSDPNNISPNVVLRPIFQELIFPNLAYIGGGGELAYWLERNSLFAHWEIPYPMLIRRDSLHIIDKKTAKLIDGSDISIVKFFDREDHVLEAFTRSLSSEEINLQEEKKALNELYVKISEKLADIDPTLKKTALGEASKGVKSLDYLESKMLKAEKSKHEIQLNRVRKAKQKLFPGNNSLQERYDNFIPYYLKYGKTWISHIISIADPMDKSMKVLLEEA